MSDEYRVLVVPKSKSLLNLNLNLNLKSHVFLYLDEKTINELKLFRFKKFAEPILLAISQDFSQLYKIVQIEGTSTKNSWFFGDHIIRGTTMKISYFLFLIF